MPGCGAGAREAPGLDMQAGEGAQSGQETEKVKDCLTRGQTRSPQPQR